MVIMGNADGLASPASSRCHKAGQMISSKSPLMLRCSTEIP
jgi:hypothetical protein